DAEATSTASRSSVPASISAPRPSSGTGDPSPRPTHDPNAIVVPEGAADCQAQRVECQLLTCPYGLQKSLDGRGCHVCSCHDPCERHRCPEATQCAVDLSSDADADFLRTKESGQWVAVCRQVNKPGRCPSPSARPIPSECQDECQNDSGCQNDLKCCHNGCAFSCAKPVPEEGEEKPVVATPVTTPVQVNKPGRCPSPSARPIPSECQDECQNDSGCQNDLKCCHNGCAFSCAKPVPEEGRRSRVVATPVTTPVQSFKVFSRVLRYFQEFSGIFKEFSKGLTFFSRVLGDFSRVSRGFESFSRVFEFLRVLRDFEREVAINKPGRCPSPSARPIPSECQDECQNDSGCQNDLKCCHNGCAFSCAKPVPEEGEEKPVVATPVTTPVQVLRVLGDFSRVSRGFERERGPREVASGWPSVAKVEVLRVLKSFSRVFEFLRVLRDFEREVASGWPSVTK
ncbi:uncharacterized protein LOC119568793, partial [Penaeus monodon]|uniref:uncharacterized protein LOC119568793 n=1 Tax=Penaeus monodon TaxID=6687 RepID=UPI0018A77062